MSERRSYPPIVHYLPVGTGGPSSIACRKSIMLGSVPRYSTELRKVTCYDCARLAEGLTVEQRIEVWDQANERCEKNRDCPWSAP